MITARQHRREETCTPARSAGTLHTHRARLRWHAGAGASDPSRWRRVLVVLAGLAAGVLLGLATSLLHGMAGLPTLAVCLCCAGAGALIALALLGIEQHG